MAVRPYIWAALAAALFFFGMRVEAWRDDAGQLQAAHKIEQQIAHANTHTQTRALATATHDQAIGAGVHTLRDRIQDFKPAAPAGKGDSHATAAACLPAMPYSPWADPQFRVFYDAGSDPTGPAGEAGAVPANPPGHAPLPHP